MADQLPTIGNETVTDILKAVQSLPVMKAEDVAFLQEKSAHLANVLEKTHIWRTDAQKLSIVNDFHFPTLHAKFHQAMLEQKVQFEQTMYLARDFEMKKLEIAEVELDISLLQGTKNARDQIKLARLELDAKFKTYELNQMRIAMHYRMEEVRGWQSIQEHLLSEMRNAGMTEEEIWSKNAADNEAMFFLALNNLQSLQATTDSAERGNIISLATHVYKNAVLSGTLDHYRSKCNAAQIAALGMLEGKKN